MPSRQEQDVAGPTLDRVRRDGRMWTVVTGVPGWEDYAISLRATLTGSEPTVTALHVDPVAEVEGLDLTGYKLRSLPIKALARASLDWGPDVYRNALSSLHEDVDHADPRAATTVGTFAAKWLEGHEAGKPPQSYARKALNLSQSSAERYARRARAAGLIPETKRSRARGATPNNRREQGE